MNNIFELCETTEIVIREFSDIHKMVELFEGPFWLFKGFSEKDGRLCPDVLLPANSKLIREKNADLKLFHDWLEKSQPFLNNPGMPLLDAYVLAHLHGLPSRLLEWTRSLPVAVFLAAMGKSGNAGRKWVYTEDTVIFEKPLPEKGEEDYLVYAFKWSDRISSSERRSGPSAFSGLKRFDAPGLSSRFLAQQTVFTIQPALTGQGSMKKPELLYRLSFPGCLRKRFLDRLNGYNINPMSVFPGPQGITMDLCQHLYLKNNE